MAVSQDNTTVLGEGKLAVIDNQIDPTTATIKLKATFPNTDLRLWPGQFVNARLLVNVRKGSVVVPGFGNPTRTGRGLRLRHQG